MADGDVASSPSGSGGGKKKYSKADVEIFLGNVKYPASRDGIVDYAVGINAPDEFISELQSLPEREYGGWSDVYQEM